MDISLRDAFGKIKNEFDEHIESINENTNEINSNYEYILQLESKINKLNEKLDEVLMHIRHGNNGPLCRDPSDKIALTSKEQEVFLILYARDGDLIDHKEIAKLLGLTQHMVIQYISNMMLKGIPIIKKYIDDNTYLVLDSDFRTLQAKNNLVGINESISMEMQIRKVI